MAQAQPTTKKQIISKTNAQIVGITSAASFVIVFCLVASFQLVGQLAYQNRVIGAKKQAMKVLNANLAARDNLVAKYKDFVAQPTNLIKGNSSGVGTRDGDNGKITLDALPSKYDFPALTTSIEGMLTAQAVKIQQMTGNDDEVAQAANQSSPTPQPIAMPFEVTTLGDYQSTQRVLQAFEASIRPIQMQAVNITAGQDGLTLDVTAQTFYQPEKSLNVTTKVVK